MRRLPTVAPKSRMPANRTTVVWATAMIASDTAWVAARATVKPAIGNRGTTRPPARRATIDMPASPIVANAAVVLSVRSSTSLTICCVPPTCEAITST